jgi:hypothetical protein
VEGGAGNCLADGASAHPKADAAISHILAAMTAGATGTIVTNPIWVVKTRFMVSGALGAVLTCRHKRFSQLRQESILAR